MNHLLYYVSSHGFGHASRSSEVVRELAARRPGLRQTVLTSAPAAFFAGIPGVTVRAPAQPLDAGVVEFDPMRPDRQATTARLMALLDRRSEIAAAAAAEMRAARADAVLCDVPFLAGDAAARAGLPCTAISNFTWDWIYEPYLSGHPRAAEAVMSIRSSYAKIGTLLRMPFGETADVFGRTIDLPLVTALPRRSRAETTAALGIDPSDERPRVLVATRGRLAATALAAAAAEGPEFLFLCGGREDMADASPSDNVRLFPRTGGPRFVDIVAAADVVISKLGYGIVAECLAARTALLYPPRRLFREDELTAAAIPEYIRAAPMPAEDFDAGRWVGHIRVLLAAPVPGGTIRIDGAAVAAEHILSGL